MFRICSQLQNVRGALGIQKLDKVYTKCLSIVIF
jgi:hypothetical protein